MEQSPMISCPLKQTAEIDWVQPLRGYIRQTYGDDPDRYAEECATLNRLRQDMRGAGKDSASGRDLLYRYYGQLELLDLRFPVDENHIKISFTWYDAFTHKATSQYSLAYEKASIIFNISAVLSCHAANQSRSEDVGLKTAYHSFQASAGMFTYINDNFLHAPSTDLSRDTVKTLISITLAQAQEVFLEKQISDGKKPGFLAKLASQAAHLYSQATEGVLENVSKGIFEKVWSIVTATKTSYMSSLAGFYQAIADDEGGIQGTAIARLQLAEKNATTAINSAKSFPSTIPSGANLPSDIGSLLLEMLKRHLAIVQERLTILKKDNDFIYHQPVPVEAALSAVAKLPAAKAIPVSELYQGQDIQRIIGPDIFQKIVPISVTESASLYDEEKAKLIRAETEKVEAANGEMAASLDYLKLPGSLNVLKGTMDDELSVDEKFSNWCEEVAGQEPFRGTLEELQEDKQALLSNLEQCTKQLDMEESVCEKMRSKYGADWTQQPSSRMTSTLRADIRSYRETIDEASSSDSQLLVTLRQHETDLEEMRAAGESGEQDVLFQQAMVSVGSKYDKNGGKNGSGTYSSKPREGALLDEVNEEGGFSIAEQIGRVEELLRKLNLVEKDRMQTLKDLKDKVRNDDISNVLILNKKAIANQEEQLFQTELEKFRPHQTRLMQANHKQTAIMKELAKVYGDLLQDKRVRSEQSKYEALTRQRNAVTSKYKRAYKAFKELLNGLSQAQAFYMQMRDSIDNLQKNVEAFVSNRRSEGAQLLTQIERDKMAQSAGQDEREQEKLKRLMERLSVEQAPQQQQQPQQQQRQPPRGMHELQTSRSPTVGSGAVSNSAGRIPSPGSGGQVYTSPISYPGFPPPSTSNGVSPIELYNAGYPVAAGVTAPAPEAYNPMAYLYHQQPHPHHLQQPPVATTHSSPAASSGALAYGGYGAPPPPPQQQQQHQQGRRSSQYLAQGYMVPPPPPPPPIRGPSPISYGHPYSQPQNTGNNNNNGNSNSGGAYGDPWAGLNMWK